MTVKVKVAKLAQTRKQLPGWWAAHRPWTWGADPEEVAAAFPYPDLVPEGKRSPTMAVTIDASPEQVWPWLVQLGWNRGGWYSWDLLDNGGRPSATEVHPEWQDIAIGDLLKFRVFGRDVDAYKVGVIEPNKYLGLYGYTTLGGRWLNPEKPRPSSYMEGTWGFQLTEQLGDRTRLVISGYQTYRPRWVERFVASWLVIVVVWPMQARMLAVLKRNIERAAKETPRQPSPSSPPDEARSTLGLLAGGTAVLPDG